MNFVKIENKGKKLLEQFPIIKRIGKRMYQIIMYAISNDKIKSEGNIRRVSPIDNYEYFFGYYDISPWDSSDRYMICLKVKNAYKSVAPKDKAEIIVIDTYNNNTPITIGHTHSWNVQQGCMAQWVGPDNSDRIIYNDFREGNFCSVIFNFKTRKEEKVLPLPVYNVSRDGKFALTLDFTRLHSYRKGYGYSNTEDKSKDKLCPDETCIWKINLQNGKVQELFKYTDFRDFEPREEMHNAIHKVNHLMINPDGDRFMVLHRWFKNGRKYTRLVTASTNGGEMFNLNDDNFTSHCFWKNNNEILSFMRKHKTGDHYYLIKDKTNQNKLFWPELNTDGHCSYNQTNNWIVTDTYPNRKRIASVYLCKEEDNSHFLIARVFSPFKYDNDVRCDLHPRWNYAATKICIDSVHDGKRGLYIINPEILIHEKQ